ncbi:protein transport protein SEC31 [Diospyros lotus]|uniref:protein transport protein SEC31 n=1 Tax=Diospyros lotus TaxID=55363 RepID=UPI00224D7B9C|nr:protein transport protein SEC31 [Diospyros lotus]
MTTSRFMDKQIMDLSNSKSNDDFIDLKNPQGDHIGLGKKEEIEPSYDFQPIRPIGASQPSNSDSGIVGGTRAWNSVDSKTNTTGIGFNNYSSLESIEPGKVISEKDRKANNAALVSEIDQAMKKHVDNLLHALEAVSARISQLESRTRHLEDTMDDLKVSLGNNHGNTDGKLRQLDNIVREVQAGVQVIRDKQDIVEGQLQSAKLQMSKVEQQTETQNTVQSDSLQQVASASQQSHQQLPPAIIQPPSSIPSLPNVPPPASSHNLPPPVHVPNQFPSSQNPFVAPKEPFFPPSQKQEPTNQQYHVPSWQLQAPFSTPPLQPSVPAPPPQQYQPPPHPQYSQTTTPPQQHPSFSTVSPQTQPPLGHHPDEAPYPPPQNYPPSLHQPPHPPGGNHPSQQFYGAPSQIYEAPSSRPGSGYSNAYGPSSGANEPYPYGGPPSQYDGGSMKQQQLPPAAAQGGGSSYSQLPTARILPHALPTASGVGAGSGSAGTGNRVPMDDVVDKVTNMGFSRDQVRATVRKLTENGQSVDLNIVLDKLMNDGEGQPQRGWLGR